MRIDGIGITDAIFYYRSGRFLVRCRKGHCTQVKERQPRLPEAGGVIADKVAPPLQ